MPCPATKCELDTSNSKKNIKSNTGADESETGNSVKSLNHVTECLAIRDDDVEKKHVDVDARPVCDGELISRRPILSRSPVLAILSTWLRTNANIMT
jgi:hypothetical protein